MKVVIFLFICIFFMNNPITVKATDKDTYALCESSNVKFYSDASTDAFLFYLPESYYLKVLSKGANFTHVECFGNQNAPLLDGYVLSDSVRFLTEDISEPYLDFSIQTATDTNIYGDSDFSSVVMHVFKNRSLTYYGNAYDKTGGYIYYVSYNNRFGYVSEKDVMPFTLPVHSGYVLPTDKTEPDTSVTSKTQENIPLVIIIIMSFACLVIMFSLLKPVKNKRTYDEF